EVLVQHRDDVEVAPQGGIGGAGGAQLFLVDLGQRFQPHEAVLQDLGFDVHAPPSNSGGLLPGKRSARHVQFQAMWRTTSASGGAGQKTWSATLVSSPARHI